MCKITLFNACKFSRINRPHDSFMTFFGGVLANLKSF